jgi:hypothetical protein
VAYRHAVAFGTCIQFAVAGLAREDVDGGIFRSSAARHLRASFQYQWYSKTRPVQLKQ